MNLDAAILEACNTVGIRPPRTQAVGKWLTTDTLDGKSGKGDGRVIVNGKSVTGWNWQTGERATVWLDGEPTKAERKEIARKIAVESRQKQERAARAAVIAERMVSAARPEQHPYLVGKGFREERPLVLAAAIIRELGGFYDRHGEFVPADYLIAGERAIVMPARIGPQLSSVQLIWEDGRKKFLAGGEITGACHRIGKGAALTWLCEGFATGLSLRAALQGMMRNDTVLCCFSASNIVAVSRQVKGRCFVVADNDKSMPQFDGLGTGEWYAQLTERPYLMPTVRGDINDIHQDHGIFAVQRLIGKLIREARA